MSKKIDPLIAIGIPTFGKVSISWANGYRQLGGPLGSNSLMLAPVVGKDIATARNELMEAAFQANADFLFFLGDDTIPQGDAILRLLQRMWNNPEINLVTGVYWTKAWPTQPYIWRGHQRGPYLDWKYGEFFEIDYAGCDCLLIRLTPELRALGPEWFSTEWKWNKEDGPALLATEDFYFYTKTRGAGMKLWCDTEVQCVHEDRNSGMQFGLTAGMPQWEGAQEPPLPEAGTDAAPLVKLADIGCGFDAPYFGSPEKVKIVRFDTNEKVEPDYRCDIRHLPVPDQSFDIVHSRHVIEHFGRGELKQIMREWTRILRIGGEFRISCPNLMSALQHILLMEQEVIPVNPYPFWQLYGRQDDEYDVHKNGFTPTRMKMLLEGLGIFEDIEVETRDGEQDDLNIYAKATKVRHLDPAALLPEWDAIEEREGITVAGRKGEQPVPSAITTTQQAVADAEKALRKPRKRKRPVGPVEWNE